MSEYSGVLDYFKNGIGALISQPPESRPENIKKLIKDFEINPSGGFMQFNNHGVDTERISASGWKFHMSTAPEHSGRALEIMLEEFKKSGNTGAFKIAIGKNFDKFSDPSHDQSGKMFTIYDDGTNPEATKKLLQRLEERFQKEGIKAGPTVKGDRAVPGSSYSSYRNDRLADGSYSSDKSDYNKSKRPDPFVDFKVQQNAPAPHAAPIAPAANTATDPNAESRKVIAEAQIVEAQKKGKDGQMHDLKYMGVGSTPLEVEHIENNLKKQGLRIGVDYDVKPSSLNGGGNVISLTEQGASRVQLIQNIHQQEISKPQPAAAPQNARPEQAHLDAASQNARAQLADPNYKPINAAPSALATSPLTHTSKGTYMGVGASQAEFDNIRKELEKKGLKEGTDFNVKPSSVNGGNNVIVLSNESATKITNLQAEHQSQAAKVQQPQPSAPATPAQPAQPQRTGAPATNGGASVSAISSAPLAAAPAQNSGIVASFNGSSGASQLQNQPAPQHNAPMMGNLALAPEPQIPLNLAPSQQQQIVNPSNAPQAANSGATPATPAAQQAPASPPPTPAAPSAQQAPANPPPAAPKPEQAHLDAASQAARTQLADPNYKPAQQPPSAPAKPAPAPTKVDIDVSEPHSSGKPSLGGTGQKVDGHAGKASLAIQVANEAAKGNYVAAATTAAVAIAEQQGIKFVAKRIPVVGAIVTVGMTLWSSGAAAAQGNFKKAGSELIAGAAESAGNIVGFGAGDAAREAARKGLMVAGVKEENAPDKSGIRQAAETAINLGKTIVDASKLKSMNKTDLAKTIQTDPNLPHEINLKGQKVTLAQAMEDKTFRTTFIKGMEEEAKKNPAAEKTVAALKEYAARLDASSPTQQAAAKPAATPATPATSATASAKPTPSAAAIAADAQYKSMTTAQLASTIQKDATLPDTVKIGKNDVLLADALKDKEFRKAFLDGLEKAQANGSDLHAQIAMVKAYEVALAKPQPNGAPTTQMAQNPKVSAPAMA